MHAGKLIYDVDGARRDARFSCAIQVEARRRVYQLVNIKFIYTCAYIYIFFFSKCLFDPLNFGADISRKIRRSDDIDNGVGVTRVFPRDFLNKSEAYMLKRISRE